MNASQLIRAVAEMGPNVDYRKNLLVEFDIAVPDGTPLYYQEYLYKYCLQEHVSGTTKDKIELNANVAVNKLILRFPHICKKYQDVVNGVVVEKVSVRRNQIPDYTVIHHVKNARFYFWLGGVVTVSSKSIEVLDKCLLRKYGSVPAYNLTVKS